LVIAADEHQEVALTCQLSGEFAQFAHWGGGVWAPFPDVGVIHSNQRHECDAAKSLLLPIIQEQHRPSTRHRTHSAPESMAGAKKWQARLSAWSGAQKIPPRTPNWRIEMDLIAGVHRGTQDAVPACQGLPGPILMMHVVVA